LSKQEQCEKDKQHIGCKKEPKRTFPAAERRDARSSRRWADELGEMPSCPDEGANEGAAANAADATKPPAPHKTILQTYRAMSGSQIANIPSAKTAITAPETTISVDGTAPRCKSQLPKILASPLPTTMTAVNAAARVAPIPRSSIMKVGIQVMTA
jgi:hypothetical protein